MARLVKTLTDEAKELLNNFRDYYGDDNCACHINPPCSACTDPGNPLNLAEDDNNYHFATLITTLTKEAIPEIITTLEPEAILLDF